MLFANVFVSLNGLQWTGNPYASRGAADKGAAKQVGYGCRRIGVLRIAPKAGVEAYWLVAA
jgi:hypothetical protein